MSLEDPGHGRTFVPSQNESKVLDSIYTLVESPVNLYIEKMKRRAAMVSELIRILG